MSKIQGTDYRCVILHLKDYFEAHRRERVTLDDLSDYLSSKGITCGRKVLYQNIDSLRDYGMIIDGERGRSAGYICWETHKANIKDANMYYDNLRKDDNCGKEKEIRR